MVDEAKVLFGIDIKLKDDNLVIATGIYLDNIVCIPSCRGDGMK